MTKAVKYLIFILIIFSSSDLQAQVQKIQGYVYDDEMTPLSNAEIRFRLDRLGYNATTQPGASTDKNGYYEIQLSPGRYQVFVSSPGYLNYKTVLIVDQETVNKNFILSLNLNIIEEATVSANKKDISKRVVKNVIDEKKKNAIIQYSYDAYVLARSTEDSSRIIKTLDRKKRGNKSKTKKKQSQPKTGKTPSAEKDSVDQFEIKRSIGEAALHVTRAHPDKISETREALKITGSKEQLFYLSAMDGEFNFLKNLMYERALGETPFLSPFSNNGLIMYRYEMLDIQNDGYGLVYHISFRPNSISNNLLTGEVWVTDKTWKVIKIQASFPNNLTPAFDHFQIQAEYEEIEYGIYLPTKFEFDYQMVSYDNYKAKTMVRFENYNLDSVIDRKKFSALQSQTLQSAYEKDSTFWTQNRTIPLTEEDIKYIRSKDSLNAFLKSDHYRDSVETENNKVTLLNIVVHGQVHENWRKDIRWYFPSLPELIDPISPGGIRIAPAVSFFQKFKNKKELRVFPRVSYGTLNHDWMYSFNAYALLNPIKRTKVFLRMGKSMDNIFWSDAIANVLSRKNFYLKNMVNFRSSTELLNGLEVGMQVQWANRSSIHDYKFYSWWDNIINPDSSFDNTPVYFEPYNAMFAVFSIEYTPKQMYVREPYEKIILGSKWPTLYLYYKKGLKGIFGSVLDYDYLETGFKQKINLASIGISQYNLLYGNFFNENNVELVDYKRIAQGNDYIFFNPMYSFQNMDSTFSLFKGFLEGHYRHDFNGFLLSKIPYAGKLKMTEVFGMSLLHAPERSLQYVEVYLGLEKIIRIFKTRIKLGVFGIKAFNNQFPSPPTIKFGISVYDNYSNSWN